MSDGPGGPLRLGLVGCGRLATAGYLPAIAALGPDADVRLVAVADPDLVRRTDAVARSAGGSGRVDAFGDLGEMLDGVEVDGVILATPVHARLGDAERAAAAGLAVLAEKPPARSAAGAAALAALTPAPWVGFNRRFDAGARAVRQAVPAEGPVQLRLEIGYRRRSWRAFAVRDEALLDLGPHLVDWARWIGSCEVVEVACSELTTDRVTAELVLSGGGRATIRAATNRPHAERVEVRDGSGRLVARHRLGGLAAAVAGRVRRGAPDALVASLAGQLEAFAAAIRGEAPGDLGTAADGLAAMTVIDAARASAADAGRAAPVPHPVER
jgi:predicted dehydrogenase